MTVISRDYPYGLSDDALKEEVTNLTRGFLDSKVGEDERATFSYTETAELIKIGQQELQERKNREIQSEIDRLATLTGENAKSASKFGWISLLVSATIGLVTFASAIYYGEAQVAPIRAEQQRAGSINYDFCKEPGNWDTKDGGSTPGSTCKQTYVNLRAKFETYPSAEAVLMQ